MNIRITAIRHLMRSLRAHLGKKSSQTSSATDEPPLRSGLFSAEQMEHHGKALAMSHTLQHGRPQDRLLKRLAENEGVLLGVRVLLTEAVKANRRIAPAGEWLLDNFYLIEEQMQTAKRHLPTGYSRELPRLQNGQSAGLPRVYDIALETIAHGDGLVESGKSLQFREGPIRPSPSSPLANSGQFPSCFVWHWSKIFGGWPHGWPPTESIATLPTPGPTR